MFPFVLGHIGDYKLDVNTVSNVFKFPSGKQDAEITYKREKPLSLYKALISLYGSEGCWILDLCSGAGTDKPFIVMPSL